MKKEEIKEIILTKGKGDCTEGDLNKIKDRIFVILNSNIFSFPSVDELQSNK